MHDFEVNSQLQLDSSCFMRFPAKVFKHVCDAVGVPVTVGNKSCSSPLDHFNPVLQLPLVGLQMVQQ